MKRTILIPTDFSSESLDMIEHVIEQDATAEFHFVLTHCCFMSDCPINLLYFSKTELVQSLKTPEYIKKCNTLRRRYADRKITITTEIFTGLNQAAFANFIDGNRIDEAVIPKRYAPRLNLDNSFNPLPFIKKSRLKITEVALGHPSPNQNKHQPHLELIQPPFLSA
ncbi:MAG: hypothetical protein Kow0065_07800 [Methylomicrobium sp.]